MKFSIFQAPQPERSGEGSVIERPHRPAVASKIPSLLDVQQQLDSILAAVQAAPQLLPQVSIILRQASTSIASLQAIEDLSAEQATPFPAAEGDMSLARLKPFIEQGVSKRKRRSTCDGQLSSQMPSVTAEKWKPPQPKKKMSCKEVLASKTTVAKENKAPQAVQVAPSSVTTTVMLQQFLNHSSSRSVCP